MTGTVHIIGAGLSGLSAAVRLASAGRDVVVHEATAFAGGRCRSYHDATLGMTIDNGNHLLLSGNRAALDYLRRIGAEHLLVGPTKAEFNFADLASGERWTLRFNDGRVPVLGFRSGAARARHARARLSAAGAVVVRAGRQDASARSSPARASPTSGWSSRFSSPRSISKRRKASARLAGAIIRETLAMGGRACRPLIAREGLGTTLVEPALAWLEQHGVTVRMEHQLRAMRFGAGRVEALEFGGETIALGSDDAVVLAVPPYAATALVERPRGTDAISRHRQRAFPHRAAAGAAADPRRAQRHGGVDVRLSGPACPSPSAPATGSSMPRARSLRRRSGARSRTITGLPAALPPWQIVRERRATFAATPEQDAKRPGPATPWRNLVLAGDWTDTGLPATIEGAIRSGNRAAELVVEQR